MFNRYTVFVDGTAVRIDTAPNGDKTVSHDGNEVVVLAADVDEGGQWLRDAAAELAAP